MKLNKLPQIRKLQIRKLTEREVEAQQNAQK